MCEYENSGCGLPLIIPQESISCRFTSFLPPHDTFAIGESSALGDSLPIHPLSEAINRQYEISQDL